LPPGGRRGRSLLSRPSTPQTNKEGALRHHRRLLTGSGVAAVVAGAALIGLTGSSASSPSLPATTTPIKHVVVIFDENVSFDHYFATYPNAQNNPGEPPFDAAPNTPSVNGLSAGLLTNNPNLDNPERLAPSQALTCDMNHGYSNEQEADDGGLMDHFVQDTTGTGCTQSTTLDKSSYGPNGIVMDYYDGNTVTGLWNLAQHYALNDNFFDTQFGPSTPGAINLISGNTSGAVAEGGTSSSVANGTMFGDTEPYYDLCSNNTTADTTDTSGDAQNGDPIPGGTTVAMTGKNVGDLMNGAGVTWGWFQGGFAPGATVPAGSGTDTLQDAGSATHYAEGTAARPACNTSHANIGGAQVQDYVEHHEPFQYYASTANPMHNAPASVSDVGQSDPAGTPVDQAVNHQYDLGWFDQSLSHGNLPQVSFLKPPAYQNAHPGNSDPLDEQKFVVDTINAIEQSPDWSSTAIFITYDDSDGWYDHVLGPVVRQSQDTVDDLDGAGKCGSSTGTPATQDRCGVGPRLPLLVISPWAKQNYVDNTFAEQASITQFIEDNWSLGRIGQGSADLTAGSVDGMFDFNPKDQRAPAIIMNDTTGEIVKTIPAPGGGKPVPPPPKVGTKPGHTNNWAGTIRCAVNRHERHAVTVTCNVSKSATTAFRDQRIEVLLHRHGRLAGSRIGRFGHRIQIHGRFEGRYTLAVDFAGNVKVVRAFRVA
jgi:phospholipase C